MGGSGNPALSSRGLKTLLPCIPRPWAWRRPGLWPRARRWAWLASRRSGDRATLEVVAMVGFSRRWRWVWNVCLRSPLLPPRFAGKDSASTCKFTDPGTAPPSATTMGCATTRTSATATRAGRPPTAQSCCRTGTQVGPAALGPSCLHSLMGSSLRAPGRVEDTRAPRPLGALRIWDCSPRLGAL